MCVCLQRTGENKKYLTCILLLYSYLNFKVETFKIAKVMKL